MERRSVRFRHRLTLGVGAVLTVAEAAALLPMADADARAWLASRGLVRDLDGRRVVRWCDVLDAIGGGDLAAAPPRARLPGRRVALPPL